MEEAKTVSKTLSLRILRPLYSAEIEKEIKEEKERRKQGGKSGELDSGFYKKLEKKHTQMFGWDKLNLMLSQLQRQIARVFNQSISELYIETVIQGKKSNKHYTSKIVYNRAYSVFYNAYLALGITSKVEANFRSTELLMQKSSLPTAKSDNFPILLHKQKGVEGEEGGFKISADGNDLIFEIPIPFYEYDSANKKEPFKWIKKGGQKPTIKLILSTFRRQRNKGWAKDEGTDAEIRKVIEGKYQVSHIEINRGKKLGDHQKWFVNFTIEQPIYERKLDKNIIGGIDVGIKSPLVCAVNNSFARYSVDSNDVLKFSKQAFAFRRRLLSKNSLKRSGHGSKNKLDPITRMTEKNDRFRKKIIERWAKEVTNFFIKNQVGTVQIEDLSTMKDRQDNFFNQYLRGFWPYYQMQNLIENKLKEYGIETKRIKARYTSQLCSNPSCRHWNSYFSFDHRKTNNFPKFKCEKCALEISADYNAARNISTPDIEKFVAKATKGINLPDKNENVILE
nr:CRISPR-associated protein Cas14a.2 [uncultured archaeon]